MSETIQDTVALKTEKILGTKMFHEVVKMDIDLCYQVHNRKALKKHLEESTKADHTQETEKLETE